MRTRTNEYHEVEQYGQAKKSHGSTRKETKSLFVLSLQTGMALLLGLGAALSPLPASAGVLATSGQLTLPTGCPSAPGCGNVSQGTFPTVNQGPPNTFTGVWPGFVDPRYGGQFTGTGPYPSPNGTNTFDFTSLTAGFLPAGSIIRFGDLDSASGSEDFFFKALGASNNALSTWANDAFYVSGTTPSDFLQSNMPEYKWNSVTQTYKFDGDSVASNPNLGVWITTNQDIYHLTVVGDTNFAGYAFAAPAPEPASLLLMGSGLAGLAGLIRRRLIG